MRSHLRLARLLTVAAWPLGAQELPVVTPRPGMVITRSARLRPGVYRLRAPASVDSALVVVRGDDVTVDFGGATLVGTAAGARPDEAAGVAVRIDGGRHVTLRRATIHGYRVAVLARGTRGLRVEGGDLSGSWKPRLYSLVEHESLVDWLSFHHNEHREWLRFGAAIYLEDVRGGEIRGVRAEQGMNALLLTRSDSLLVRSNDFSFNSGLGVGLYRSSDNRIMHNRVDYDVRGYSHGFYRRGQDSAGILVYEQSCRNVVAYNSATHGGDGFFLWAGQTTMDTGEGGANDNVVVGNDFSYAPANGIEATFSRNTFIGDTVAGSDYGLWGGYSFATRVAGNLFRSNRVGVAIEHGRDDAIDGNRFVGDSTAVSLWANPIEPSDWGYPKHRDTRSRGYEIRANTFERNRVVLRATNTRDLTFVGNTIVTPESVVVLKDTAAYRADGNRVVTIAPPKGPRQDAVPPLPDSLRRLVPEPLRAERRRSRRAALPRSAIVVDEWGPYDWRRAKLWPADSTRAVPLRLQVLGPPGRWRVVSRRGVTRLSRTAGRVRRLGVPDTVEVTPYADSAGDWSVAVEFRYDFPTPPGRAADTAAYGRFEPRTDWTARVVAWSDGTDPRTRPEAFAALLRGVPLVERRLPRLDLMWYRPTIPGIPQARWALEATSAVTLPPGTYTLRTISDDAIRVWVDGALLVDHWTPHESEVDAVSLGGGRHALRVQYAQVDGWAELRVEIVRGAPRRSAGSPGPH